MYAMLPDQEQPDNPAEEEWLKELEEKFEILQKMRHDYECRWKTADEDLKFKSHASLDIKIADQKLELEKKLFLQEADNINNIKEDKIGYLKVHSVLLGRT